MSSDMYMAPEVAGSRLNISMKHDHPLMHMLADILNGNPNEPYEKVLMTVLLSKGNVGLTLAFEFMNVGSTYNMGNNTDYVATFKACNQDIPKCITYTLNYNDVEGSNVS